VAADWKVLIEHWLEMPATPTPSGAQFEPTDGITSSYVRPHQLLVAGPDGLLVLQAVPAGAGRTRLRIHDYPRHPVTAARPATGAPRSPLAATLALAESVQRGIESPGYVPGALTAPPPALADFRRAIARLLPGGSRHSGD
jgi:hypothetical protein